MISSLFRGAATVVKQARHYGEADTPVIPLRPTVRSSHRARSKLALMFAFFATLAQSPVLANEAPTLRRNGAATQLMVDGRPFLILGGETFNSTASSVTTLAPVLDRLAAAHANTVLAPVSWDQLEPVEGQFDFSATDMVLQEAAKRDLRVVILWLAAFKNARSTYAPTWVRADRRRFPRAVTTVANSPSGAITATLAPVLSVFTPALVAADARAFAALMQHLAAVDRDHRVIMVQVENEVGLLGDSRDRSTRAMAAWQAPVPSELTDGFARRGERLTPEIAASWGKRERRRTGTWSDLFGSTPGADEIFMAWHFARYVERVAAAGRAVSPLPLYTNAWLGPEPGEPLPGTYPSGGPTAAMLDVWKIGAPTLAFLSPDIYVDDARGVHARYARDDNPLFVPEERFRPGNLFWAIGQHRAIGQATFGIDAIRPGSELAAAYRVLGAMGDTVTRAQAQRRIAGVLIEGEEVQTILLGGLTFSVRGADAFWRRARLDAGQQPPPKGPPPPSEIDAATAVPPDPRPYGLIVEMGPGTFLFTGRGFLIDATRDGKSVELDRIVEGRFVDGRWVGERWVNGDDYGTVVPRDGIGTSMVRFLPTG